MPPACAQCGAQGPLKACTRCRLDAYCGPACQKQHWPTHKARCKAPEVAQSAAATTDPESSPSYSAPIEAPATRGFEAESPGKKFESTAAVATPAPVPIAQAKAKKLAAASIPDCANCASSDLDLNACARCRLVSHCSQACQVQHWKKGGHKERCVAVADRKPTERTEERPTESSQECAICLGAMAEATACRLPCGHLYHGECVESLRKFGIQQACPLCRAALPAGAEKQVDEAVRRYMVIERRVASGSTSWATLSRAHQQEMSKAVQLMREAADQGHAHAQCNLGIMHEGGRGVKQNDVEAVRWLRKAADKGHAQAQGNLGVMYAYGRGVEQKEAEAVRWYR